MSEPCHRLHTLPARFHSDETGMPFQKCFNCMDHIVGLLSAHSREAYDRWMDRVLPQAPEMSDDKPRVRVFL